MSPHEISTPRLTVEPAEPTDASAVEALLDGAAAWQRSRGIEQWTPGRFGDEVHQTIASGELFVGRRRGAVVGCFMLDPEGLPSVRSVVGGAGPRRGSRRPRGAHGGRL